MIEQTSSLDDLKNLFSMDTLEKVDKNKLHTLIRWVSFEPLNLGIAMKLNKYFYYMPKKTILYALYFKLHKQKTFIRYLKQNQEEEDRLLFLKKELQEYYDWSDKELKQNWELVEMLIKDKNNLIDLDRKFGFSEEECKVLNIPYNKPKLVKLEEESNFSVSEWV
ncbi:MAG: hypothetical protein AABY22_29760 [Nanoarchaeota archaeon]